MRLSCNNKQKKKKKKRARTHFEALASDLYIRHGKLLPESFN